MTGLRNSTITRIVAIRNTFPPALAKIETSDLERFPVFSGEALTALRAAVRLNVPVWLDLRYTANGRTCYPARVVAIDVTATERPCIADTCHGVMRREAGIPPRFVCGWCARRLYLGRVKAVSV